MKIIEIVVASESFRPLRTADELQEEQNQLGPVVLV